ncbi:N-acetylmuramic acid 6-phosphate etherase [Chloroflexales bacterium ZM16-3]|nr:N-acetylmuramic acid 6-phosphate etherase [Chloroflexales bacterium ZM16-3]
MSTTTEGSNVSTKNLDLLSIEEILCIMNEEDTRIPVVIKARIPEIAEAIKIIIKQLELGGRIIYVGAGTSGRIANLDAIECPATFNTPPEMIQAIVAGKERALHQTVYGAEDDLQQGELDLLKLNPDEKDVVVGIAASGKTPYVIGALRAGKQVGASIIAISSNDPAPILDLADVGIPIVVGPEVITGSTRLKAGTAQKIVLNMLSTVAMVKLGKVYGNLMVDLRIVNHKLEQRAIDIIVPITGLTRDESKDLLSRCNGEVKCAIIVGILGIEVNDAKNLLLQNQGNLRSIIG